MTPPCDISGCPYKAAWILRFYKNGMIQTMLWCGHHVNEEQERWEKDKWQLRIKAHTGR